MIQILAGIAIVFFLPGYTLVAALFPRKGELDPEYDIVYRIALGMGLSIVIAIIVGFALNAISTEVNGYVSAGPLWISLISVTAFFFAAGWFRGAYPWMGAVHQTLYRDPPSRTVGGIVMAGRSNERQISKLVLEREYWQSELRRCAERTECASETRRVYYSKRSEVARTTIDAINDELDRVTKEGG
jgi:hypothetical protein